jgi:hypothetical protein
MTSKPLLTAALLLLSASLVYAQDCPKAPWSTNTAIPVNCFSGGVGELGSSIEPLQTPTTMYANCDDTINKFVIHSGHQTVTVTCNEPTLSVTESKTP